MKKYIKTAHLSATEKTNGGIAYLVPVIMPAGQAAAEPDGVLSDGYCSVDFVGYALYF